MEIILIDIGVFQPYLNDNIRNLKLFGNNNITIITDEHLVSNFNEKIILTSELDDYDFDKQVRIAPGFWANTSKRLFYLYSYMKKYNKKNCIHIENDYMLYFNTSELTPTDEVLLTMDSPQRCIPGFVFIPGHEKLEPLIKNYDFGKNDMINMANFYHNNRMTVRTLPIINEHSIFDAAAIGQYLGGVDPNNIAGDTRGFVNESCVVDYSLYNFYWKTYNNLNLPYLNDSRIMCLHIHCKRLHDFQADKPNEQKLIKIKFDIII